MQAATGSDIRRAWSQSAAGGSGPLPMPAVTVTAVLPELGPTRVRDPSPAIPARLGSESGPTGHSVWTDPSPGRPGKAAIRTTGLPGLLPGFARVRALRGMRRLMPESCCQTRPLPTARARPGPPQGPGPCGHAESLRILLEPRASGFGAQCRAREWERFAWRARRARPPSRTPPCRRARGDSDGTGRTGSNDSDGRRVLRAAQDGVDAGPIAGLVGKHAERSMTSEVQLPSEVERLL